MDFPVLSIENIYILFEFHKSPLTSRILLRNFQYLAEFRVRVKHPVAMQILWVNVLIDDEKLSKKLIGVIKMRSTFIEEYERNLIETTTNNQANEIASKLDEMGLSHEDILKATSIDLSKK